MNYDDIEDAILSHTGKFHREQWWADKKQADKINAIASMAVNVYEVWGGVLPGEKEAVDLAFALYNMVETRVKNEAKDG
jgi:hypothetical protein